MVYYRRYTLCVLKKVCYNMWLVQKQFEIKYENK